MTEASRYQLIIAPTARRQLSEVLPEPVAFAAYEFITGALLGNPHRVGKQLRALLDDLYSARRGTYRILYHVNDEQRVVTVIGVATRRDAYRRG